MRRRCERSWRVRTLSRRGRDSSQCSRHSRFDPCGAPLWPARVLFRDWQPAEGTVLASRPKPHWDRWHANDPFPPMEYVIEYPLEGSASQRIKLLETRGKI